MSLTTFLLVMMGIAAIVYMTRALPFFFAKKLRENKLAQVLSRSLPLAIMLLLAMHEISGSTSLIPAWISVGITAFTHLTFKQPIISIFSGTAVYVALLHFF